MASQLPLSKATYAVLWALILPDSACRVWMITLPQTRAQGEKLGTENLRYNDHCLVINGWYTCQLHKLSAWKCIRSIIGGIFMPKRCVA